MPVLDIDISKAQRLYDVNVWGPIRVIQAFSNLLIKSRGHIVNMSTVNTLVPLPWVSTYASSKTALTYYSESLRLELASLGVSVVTIVAHSVESNLGNNEPKFILPRGSRYAPVEHIIRGWLGGSYLTKDCTAAEFAELIVDSVISYGEYGVVYKGPNAGSMNIISKWGPQTLINKFFSRHEGLREMAEKAERVGPSRRELEARLGSYRDIRDMALHGR
ncbi:hypothetical protein ONZ43_g1299 [Nemania bipapillata]|uniref:Uncharacterized protein n=1 Tax=Nemania bipapillata TaxID=110536 RepID=A0ACC2J5T4_9PEZI|nr:hypothetical protein ONZ43_g1299 [Nemania bipapillata]